MKLINKTPNGQITYCKYHNAFNLEFGNLFFQFTYEELKKFSDYINSIDHEYYLEINKNAGNTRKLLLKIGFKNVFFCLHASEFIELKKLVSLNKKNSLIKNKELIDFNMIYN